MKILVFEPRKEPYVKDISDDITSMQAVVGGAIEPVYFDEKEEVIAWCNDEFLLNGSELNRLVGSVIIHGTFYICGNVYDEKVGWKSCSLTDEQINRYTRLSNQLFPRVIKILKI